MWRRLREIVEFVVVGKPFGLPAQPGLPSPPGGRFSGERKQVLVRIVRPDLIVGQQPLHLACAYRWSRLVDSVGHPGAMERAEQLKGPPESLLSVPGATAYGDPVLDSSMSYTPSACATRLSRERPYGLKSAVTCTR